MRSTTSCGPWPTGLAPPHPAQPGDTVRLELDALGGVELRFS
jgi:2-keto-4-pentenoate hydratase